MHTKSTSNDDRSRTSHDCKYCGSFVYADKIDKSPSFFFLHSTNNAFADFIYKASGPSMAATFRARRDFDTGAGRVDLPQNWS